MSAAQKHFMIGLGKVAGHIAIQIAAPVVAVVLGCLWVGWGFELGPLHLLLLAIIGLVLFGPIVRRIRRARRHG